MESRQGFRGVWGGEREGTQLNLALEIQGPEKLIVLHLMCLTCTDAQSKVKSQSSPSLGCTRVYPLSTDPTGRVKLIDCKIWAQKEGWVSWQTREDCQSPLPVCHMVELALPRLLEDLVNKLLVLAGPWDTGDNLVFCCCCVACSGYVPSAASLGQ